MDHSHPCIFLACQRRLASITEQPESVTCKWLDRAKRCSRNLWGGRAGIDCNGGGTRLDLYTSHGVSHNRTNMTHTYFCGFSRKNPQILKSGVSGQPKTAGERKVCCWVSGTAHTARREGDGCAAVSSSIDSAGGVTVIVGVERDRPLRLSRIVTDFCPCLYEYELVFEWRRDC